MLEELISYWRLLIKMTYNSRTSKRDNKQCAFCYSDMNENGNGCSFIECKNYVGEQEMNKKELNKKGEKK